MDAASRSCWPGTLASLLCLAAGTGLAAPAAPLAGLLAPDGRLQLPAGYSGSIDPAGFALVSGPGEAPRFAAVPDGAGVVAGQWQGGFGLANGCNGLVRAMAQAPSGLVYLGGSFTVCADVPANFVVAFDPATQTYSSLGSDLGNGVRGDVEALLVVGADLYVGGVFEQAGGQPAAHVARWDGSAWHALGSGVAFGSGSTARIWSLAALENDLYVGGDFTQAGGLAVDRVASYLLPVDAIFRSGFETSP